MAESITLKALGIGPAYQKTDIWMPQLMAEASRRGERQIEGKTFTDCHFEGPAVMIPVDGCHFEACDFGFSDGDIRNLMLAPMGPSKIVGAVAFKNCIFTRCIFLAVGFTGSAEFLRTLIQGVGAQGVTVGGAAIGGAGGAAS